MSISVTKKVISASPACAGEPAVSLVCSSYFSTATKARFCSLRSSIRPTGTRAQFNLKLTPDKSNLVSDFMWANHLGQSVILLRIQDYWEVLNPLDGSRSRLTDAPRLKNRFITGALELIPTAVSNDRGDWEFHWRAVTGGHLYDTGYISRDVDVNHQPALSNDGSQMAWHNGERVSTWRLGMLTDARALAGDAVTYNAFPIPGPVSLAWAPMEWVTTGLVAAVEAVPTSEPNPGICTLEPQLSPGQQAAVSPGLANRVRTAASLNAEVVGNIQAGEVVTIVQGPVCTGGYYWYSVRGAGISGWTVEGLDGDYWLLYHVDCFNSPPLRLGKGMIGAVSADKRTISGTAPGPWEQQFSAGCPPGQTSSSLAIPNVIRKAGAGIPSNTTRPTAGRRRDKERNTGSSRRLARRPVRLFIRDSDRSQPSRACSMDSSRRLELPSCPMRHLQCNLPADHGRRSLDPTGTKACCPASRPLPRGQHIPAPRCGP